MDKSNLYWGVYRNLEREFLKIAEYIYIDDTQLNVYSSKTADLLVRIAIEIESLSKYLFVKTSGVIPPGQKYAYFDTDCIKHLGVLWQIEKKKVILSCPDVYVSDVYRTLTPLKNCSKQNNGRWKKSYQAVKHDRMNNMDKATVRVLIEALAALFLLNVYNKDMTFDLGTEANGSKFDSSLGSVVFSVEVHPFSGLDGSGVYKKKESFDRCSYLIRASSSSSATVCKVLKVVDERVVEILKGYLINVAKSGRTIPVSDLEKAKGRFMVSSAKSYSKELHSAFMGLRYEAVLNKGQNLNVIL